MAMSGNLVRGYSAASWQVSVGSWQIVAGNTNLLGIPLDPSLELAAVLVEGDNLLDVGVPHQRGQLGVVPNLAVGGLASMGRVAFILLVVRHQSRMIDLLSMGFCDGGEKMVRQLTGFK